MPFVRESSSGARSSPTSPRPSTGAEAWCRTRTGMRIHGTTQRRPLEVFEAEEAPVLLALSDAPVGTWVSALTFLMGTVVVAPQASASADGCVTGWASQSCVQVQGAGSWVDCARGGVMLAARTSAPEGTSTSGVKGSASSPRTRRCRTRATLRARMGSDRHRRAGPAEGSHVCAAFQLRRSDGSYSRMSPACVGSA